MKSFQILLFPCKHQVLCNRAWDLTYSYLSLPGSLMMKHKISFAHSLAMRVGLLRQVVSNTISSGWHGDTLPSFLTENPVTELTEGALVAYHLIWDPIRQRKRGNLPSQGQLVTCSGTLSLSPTPKWHDRYLFYQTLQLFGINFMTTAKMAIPRHLVLHFLFSLLSVTILYF